jgi:hypothetical protein
MKVAIVGTSHNMTENEERDVRQLCCMILKDFDPMKTTIITGGAKGVDSTAQEIALGLMYAVKPIFPIGFGTKANLARNLEIAKECDKLFCISIPFHEKKCYHHKPPQDHEKTAGCWTMNKALELNKPCRLLVTPNRQKVNNCKS